MRLRRKPGRPKHTLRHHNLATCTRRERQGFDFVKIRDLSLPGDVKEHRVLGTVYRVPIESKNEQRKRKLSRGSKVCSAAFIRWAMETPRVRRCKT